MSLKNAAFLALIGTVLASLLLLVGLIDDAVGVVRGLIPAVKLVASFIDAFAGVTVVVFFYAFHNAQS